MKVKHSPKINIHNVFANSKQNLDLEYLNNITPVFSLQDYPYYSKLQMTTKEGRETTLSIPPDMAPSVNEILSSGGGLEGVVEMLSNQINDPACEQLVNKIKAFSVVSDSLIYQK